MDFTKVEEKLRNAITEEKIIAWKHLLESAYLATKDIAFGNLIHRWAGFDGLLGFYTKIGDYEDVKDTAKQFTIYVRMGGLNIGQIDLVLDKNTKKFVPHIKDKGTSKTIKEMWAKVDGKMGAFLAGLKETRRTLFKDISKEHWLESQLIVLANNDLAKRAGLKEERRVFKGMASIGLGRFKNKIPYQLPVPIKFDKSGELPERTQRWGYVDAILYSMRQELNVLEVKDPGEKKIDKDEPQALLQAYSYTRCLRDYAGEEFLKLSCMSKIKKYSAVAVVGYNKMLVDKIISDAKQIVNYEKKVSSKMPIMPKILTYSRDSFVANRKVKGLRWLQIL